MAVSIETGTLDPALARLAQLLGIETSFMDNQGRVHTATPETISSVAAVLGFPLKSPAEAGPMLAKIVAERAALLIEPVEVVWLEGPEGIASVPVRLPNQRDKVLECTLTLEGGDCRSWSVNATQLDIVGQDHASGMSLAWLPLGILPAGRHTLELLAAGSKKGVCHLLAAPVKPDVSAGPPKFREALPEVSASQKAPWGLFLPLHAVRSADNDGIGDFGDLKNMVSWAGGKGASLVGTLPMLAAFLEDPCEPSPYSPASRLFWNELHLDLRAIPEVAASPTARALLADAAWQMERQELRDSELVEHKRVMALKKKVLEAAVAEGFAPGGTREDQRKEFVESRPLLRSYARFRAAQARFGHSWHSWPEPERSGDLSSIGDLDPVAIYHQTVQFWANEQMAAVARIARSATSWGLYLDLPLGVNSDSFDVFSHRDQFAMGAAGGAPPDAFFTAGQNWGFPPPHPFAQRKDGYAYLFEVLRHHLEFASVLRIDHIMGLHRLWWVPHGNIATQGAYVRSRHEELYAVFCLAAFKAGARMVGEDLGTVPPAVRPSMARHDIRRLHVVQFGLNPQAEELPKAPAGSIASLNTHDLPTFASFWHGLDIADRLDLGLIDAHEAQRLHAERAWLRDRVVSILVNKGQLPRRDHRDSNASETRQDVWLALLEDLAKGDAGVVVVNAEDSWGETNPQNVPGTWRERPNWRHKAKKALESWDQEPGLQALVEAMRRKAI